MTAQATIIDGIAGIFSNTAALCIGIVAVTVLGLALEPLLQLPDVNLPWRHLTQNRSLSSVALSCRVFWTMTKYRLCS